MSLNGAEKKAFKAYVKESIEDFVLNHPGEEVVKQSIKKKCEDQWESFDFNFKYQYFENELTKKTRKRKADKDPRAPKPAVSGYMTFVNQRRPTMKAEHPELSMVDLVKKIAENWRALSDEEKKPFMDIAAADRERYMREKVMCANDPSFVPESRRNLAEGGDGKEAGPSSSTIDDGDDHDGEKKAEDQKIAKKGKGRPIAKKGEVNPK